MRDNTLFIALEGIDGSGKSTQAKLLTERLIERGYSVYNTFEPTDSPIGSLIRNIMKGRVAADHKTIAGLFVADRLDHLLNEVNGIVKKLNDGFIVITDRYYFSSYAYHGTHMDMDWVIMANSLSADILRPNINVFIDVKPELCIERINKNRSHIELYETFENLKNVRDKYLEAFKKLEKEEKVQLIDGDQAPENISDDVLASLEIFLKKQTSSYEQSI